jgi:nitronate monooxygenase
MVAGLIHDVPTVKALIDNIIDEAKTLIGARLRSMLAGTSVDKPNLGFVEDVLG